MNLPEARTLVFTLRAAFASPPWDRSTIDLYASKMQGFSSVSAARKAVDNLIESKTRRPSFAEVREEYLRVAREQRLSDSDRRGLKLPDLTEEERAENLRRVRELQEHIGKEV